MSWWGGWLEEHSFLLVESKVFFYVNAELIENDR